MHRITRTAIVPLAVAGLALGACRMTPNEVKVNLPDETKRLIGAAATDAIAYARMRRGYA